MEKKLFFFVTVLQYYGCGKHKLMKEKILYLFKIGCKNDYIDRYRTYL